MPSADTVTLRRDALKNLSYNEIISLFKNSTFNPMNERVIEIRSELGYSKIEQHEAPESFRMFEELKAKYQDCL